MKRYAVRRLLLLALLAIPMALVAACGSDDKKSSSSSDAPAASGGDAGADKKEVKKVELMFPYQSSIFFLGELIAQEKGYFAEEGLEVKVLPTEGGSFVVQQIVAGKVKFGIASPEPFMIAAAKGLPVKALMETDRGTVFIAAPADSDVKTLEDLRGKKLGIAGPGSGEVPFVKLVLDKTGLTDSVDLLPVGAGGPAVYNALKRGRIGAYAGYTNDLAGVQAAGLELVNILPPEYDSLPGDIFILTEETLANPEDKETAIGIMRAWNKGTQFALDNPEEALKLACNRVPEECKEQAVAQSFMDITLDAVGPREGKTLGAFDFEDSQIVLDGLLESKQIDKEIDLKQYFLEDYLADINPTP
jgi:NitT/TauT family transport system substrate-binding protein